MMSMMMTSTNVQMPSTLQTIWPVDKKTEGKMSRDRGFVPAKHET